MNVPDLSVLPPAMLAVLERCRECLLKNRREGDLRMEDFVDGYISGIITTLVWAKSVSKDERRELREWFLREEENNGEDVQK